MARKVIFIRGPQGAGKTTLMRKAGLEGFNLSFDKIRDIISGDILNPSGILGPSHENEAQVFELFSSSIERRVSRGEVVCVDGTLANGAQLYDMWKMFEPAGYEGLVVDLHGFDDALRRTRNAARDSRRVVPEAHVDRIKTMHAKSPIPPIMRDHPRMRILNAVNDADVATALQEISSFLIDPRTERDLSFYDQVLHIGDIQGSFAPLMDPKSPLRKGLKDNTFYVFLGDLFDRGKQNGEVGEWFMREVYGRENVAFIAGNHEDYVERQAMAGKEDIGVPHGEWERFTWPQLRAAGLTHQDCAKMAEMSQDYLAYNWRGKEVLCTHAGFGRWPKDMSLISTYQLRRGNGRYDVDVDALWNETEADTGRYQIHGHRNSAMHPTITGLSMNLEGQVEFGGHLKLVTLDYDDFTPTDIRSTVFRSMQEDVKINMDIGRQSASSHAPVMPWVARGEELDRISPEVIGKLRDHDMINLRPSETFPGVFSVNFTHQAFNKAAWDDYTMIARGLYIDGETGTIVARSYEKFFNLNERPETQSETIVDRMQYPVVAYEKSNGFLGITGYSERLGELVIASKSVTEGEFPEIAQSVIEDAIGDQGMERMLRFNRDQQASLVFEVEDPERDPHIIKLDKPNIVLLACIRRSESFEQAPYKDLEALGKWIGCPVKNRVATLPNKMALASFNRRVEHDAKWTVNGAPIEGCVMEDQNGQFYKLKSAYYRNWKRLRSAVGYMRKAKLAGREMNMERYDDMADYYKDFMTWAGTLSATALSLDIITLRDAFNGDPKEVEAILDDVPCETSEERARQERVARFEEVIEGIAANEKISEEGLARFVSAALEDPEKAEILRGHAHGQALISRAEEVSSEVDEAPGF